jgi:hypothetical protein
MLFFRLLEGAVAVGPTTYAQLVAVGGSKKTAPTPPVPRRVAPKSLVRATPPRPWRS